MAEINEEKIVAHHNTKAAKKQRKKVFSIKVFISIIIPLVLSAVLWYFYFQNYIDSFSKKVFWILFFVFIPLVIATLIVLQKDKLAGPYGETILILIPTLVWLLAGSEESIKFIVNMSGAIAAIGAFVFSISMFLKRGTFIRQILMKIGFVASSVVSTVIISIVSLEWADKGMELAGNPPDYTSKNWIIFIAVVTVVSALLLVFVGLLSSFEGVEIDKTQIMFVGKKKRKALNSNKQNSDLKINRNKSKISLKKSGAKKVNGKEPLKKQPGRVAKQTKGKTGSKK